MHKLVLMIIIVLGCISQDVLAQLIRITPDELNFGEVKVDSVAELEFTIENLAEDEYLIATVFSDNDNFTLNWTGERVETLKAMDVLRQIYVAVLQFRNDFFEDARSIEELVNAGYLELPESVRGVWRFSLIGRNTVTYIEAISLDGMLYGPDRAVVFDVEFGRFFGYFAPIGDPQEPLLVSQAVYDLNAAIISYTMDYGEEPESAMVLLDNEYLYIRPGILRNWDFTLVGENPIIGIDAVSTANMPDGEGLTIHYDIESEHISGHRIPYQEFHDWMWSLGDVLWHGQEDLTLSVSFSPLELSQYSTEISIVISQPGVAETNTFRLPVVGNGVLSAPEVSDKVPVEFILYVAYPNPFNSTTTITYGLPHPGGVSLQLYNPLGQKISTLFEGHRQAGMYSSHLTGRNLASGLYFLRLDVADHAFTQRVMLVR